MKRLIYYIVLFLPALVLGQDDQNFIKNTIYKTESTTPFSSTPAAEDGTVNITYFDGLGRPIQQIAHKQSSTGKDIITHIEYDEFGRQVKDYLPYTTTTANPSFRTDAQSRTISYYETKYEDGAAFSEKLLENSPLGRVLKQGAPGGDWQLSQGHTIDFEYSTNTTNEVKLFKALTSTMSNGAYTATLENSSGNVYYSANELFKTVVTDENGAKTEEFKDKEGRVILKRTYNVKNPQNTNRHDTYYVYDIYGNLTYVIPPKAVELGTINSTVLNNLCYQYRYDSRNRLVEKKIPGRGNPTSSSTSGWEYMVYDKLDRVIATGPVLSPFSDNPTQTGWLITKYDAHSRVAYTGWSTINVATSSANRATLQSFMNSATVINENKLETDNSINGVSLRYSNLVYPGLSPHILTVNYYDNYSFPNAPSSNPTEIEDEPVATNVKGLATGSWVRVLTSSSEYLYELTYTLYDQKARPIRAYQRNHLGGFTQTDTKLDFVGTPLKTITTHKYDSSITSLTTITEEFEYSDQGRLEKHTHKINNSLVSETLSHNTYDELGQLTIKKVGRSSSLPLQTVDYQYNIRGWLTDINDVDALADDLFAFKINYNELYYTNLISQYNGNISETYWRTSNDNVLRKYGYSYDAMNRLTGSWYTKPVASTSVTSTSTYSYNEQITGYDKGGNITGIIRLGDLDSDVDYIPIDLLTYTYDAGNRLLKVVDVSNHPEGFKDGTNSGDDYAYDIFGNMTQDLNKGIPSGGIKYNHLNLPKEISFSSTPTRKITYLYNALGQKVRKVITNAIQITTTDYQGIFHYENQVLKFIATAEGYVNVTQGIRGGGNAYNYVYNYTDHLGNIRLSYTKGTGEDSPVVLEENHYYPFGLKHKKYGSVDMDFVVIDEETEEGYYVGVDVVSPQARKTYQYKYQGQELQDELGLNWYSFKWRNYMPDIGRFFNIDPLSEQYAYQSPYNFAENKVISHFELEGLEAVLAITMGKDVKYRGDILKNAHSEAQHINIQTGGVNSFVDAFKTASASDPNGIGFVAIWGHGIPGTIYGSRADVNVNTSDLSVLNDAIKNGDVSFATDAVIYLGNCNSATGGIDGIKSFAAELSRITGATVIGGNASVGLIPNAQVENTESMIYWMYNPRKDDFISFENGIPTKIGGSLDVIFLLDRTMNPVLPINIVRPNVVPLLPSPSILDNNNERVLPEDGRHY